MKKLIALVMALAVFVPTLAFANASTDAALGLGAFAVFNQFLGGVGVFHRAPVVAAAPVVVAPAPIVAPAPLVVAPVPPVVTAPVVARPYPVYVPAPRHVVLRDRVVCAPGPHRGWCEPVPVHPGWRY